MRQVANCSKSTDLHLSVRSINAYPCKPPTWQLRYVTAPVYVTPGQLISSGRLNGSRQMCLRLSQCKPIVVIPTSTDLTTIPRLMHGHLTQSPGKHANCWGRQAVVFTTVPRAKCATITLLVHSQLGDGHGPRADACYDTSRGINVLAKLLQADPGS